MALSGWGEKGELFACTRYDDVNAPRNEGELCVAQKERYTWVHMAPT